MVQTSASSRFNPGSIDEDVIPSTDDTYDLGSDSNRWAQLFVVLALLGSIVIGTNIKLSSVGGVLVINGSGNFSGDLNVSQTVQATTFIGDGSQLTGVASEVNGTGLNITSLIISSLVNCDTINTTAAGLLECGTDSDTVGVGVGGGWTNTSLLTTTDLNVNITTGNLTLASRICWNLGCTAYEEYNGTHKFEVYP